MKTRICPFRDASFPFMCLNSRMHIRKNFWQVLLLAAFGQSSRKRHREAVALCNRALEAGVDPRVGLSALVQIHASSGCMQKLRKVAQQIQDVAPQDEIVLSKLGQAFLSCGDYETAEDLCAGLHTNR